MYIWRVLVAVLILAGGAIAQPDTRPKFEVATIKPSAPDARGHYMRTPPGGRVEIFNMTLKEVIGMAYPVESFQVSGGPTWLGSAHYDISAKAEVTPKPGQMPLMLQSLLEDRFQLRIHRETKELPIYALVMAKKDGAFGPKFSESKEGVTCTAFDPSKPPPSAPEPGKQFCGNMRMNPSGTMTASSIPIEDLIMLLSRLLSLTVIDKTGLTGKYDMSMDWTPDIGQARIGPPGGPENTQLPADSSGPSIFTALQEQLGLKLDSQKGPVEVLVIDRAEKPSEN